ncbi:MAG TPA: 16S rRNA (cytidine(1402)-2'-O)-methyltransferase [Bacteroidia bacterium]|jgi:16S rRNA (cytidine1402-2'-O)-methyltransferase|nr:16S rRNA (cytidine(1402)-2'-O)-methyltransferase [Bacteroidia bacterium]
MAKLFIVPTPIGNLEDITLRAIRILKECDVIFAEDTRNTIHLLKHFSIEKSLKSYHQHNEHKIVSEIVSFISEGKTVALVSDAGTPGISDPGFLLVRECTQAGIDVETLPGATAFVPALVNSGLPCDTFVFIGFLPQKKGRQTKFKSLAEETHTMIFYESPFRLVKTLEELKIYLGEERRASVSRELSKMFEENKRGTLAELTKYFSEKTVKGEIVIIVEGHTKKTKNGKEKTEEA